MKHRMRSLFIHAANSHTRRFAGSTPRQRKHRNWVPLFEELERRTLLAAFSINDVSAMEGNSGTTTANFTVSLSPTSSQTVTVQYSTTNGTATAPSDYSATTGTLSFSPGMTSQTISVTVNGDTVYEPTENFYVNLSNPMGATISDGQGIGTITNDDASTPTISINDVAISEGNTGTTNAVFSVSLSATSSQTVTVQFDTANGSATAPTDYATTSGTVTFAPGSLSQSITVPISGDALFEADETYYLNLSNPTGATILDGQGVGTITNDDSAPSISISDVTVTEGNSGTVSATFTVSLSTVSGQTASVSYATGDDTAIAPDDYVAASGTVTFAPGTTTQTLTLIVNGDTELEPDEGFFVNLTDPLGATITDPQGVAIIADDDAPSPLLGQISGQMFNDSNANGIKDAGELGLAGRTVALRGSRTTLLAGDFNDGAAGTSLDGFTATGLWHVTTSCGGT